MLFCFRAIQNDLKILSAPRNRNHPAPTWGQMKHCISRRKEIKYHFKREFLVSDASLCALQQWNSSEGLANQHCKYTAPPEGTKHCHSMDNTGRRHSKVAVGLMPTLAPSLFAPCLSQNTQSWAEGCRGSCLWHCLLLDCSCATKTPSTLWLLTAGPSCKAGSWLDLHLAPPLLCRKGLQRRLLSSPWSLWKGKGHANAKQQNIRC